MEDLSLHIMDIVENSVRAEAVEISVSLEVSTREDTLSLIIRDNGKGMDEEALRRCRDPFFTTKECKKTGMGISMVQQSAAEAGGTFSIFSQKNEGTKIMATFQYSHLDRKPVGDMAKTFYVLIAAFPLVDFDFVCKKDGMDFEIKTGEIKKELGDIPISAPDVLKTLRTHIYEGIRALGLQ